MKNERRKYMNNSKQDILNNLIKEPFINQRILAAQTGHSLGIVNRSIKELISEGYLDEEIRPTEKTLREAKEKAPKNAIILAAGFGMRMVPINTETPKGLLEIKGERLIERTIRQLHEVGITEIYVVVGFMKEQYEYLIDEYGVELIVAPDYVSKNNLHSLKTAAAHLSNSYIIPCDIWCEKNPYSRNELYSWYMVSDLVDDDSTVRVNRKQELVVQKEQAGGNAMIGICYLLETEAEIVRERLEELGRDSRYDGAFWEETLYRKDRMIVTARVVHAADAVEINTYEQLREIDSDSSQLQTDAIQVICEALGAQQNEVTNITVLKKGMTNRSFLFSCKDKKYIMRIPGEGTDQLINRRQEAAVYQTLDGKDICDEIVSINPENGYKITKYLEHARVCDPADPEDVRACMKKLRAFHEAHLEVAHTFSLFGQIDYYESLWEGRRSVYRDYAATKMHVMELKTYLEQQPKVWTLTHIDAVPDNFLFTKESGATKIRLIDWEYAGMQDAHVDLAMFCIYAMYERPQVDALIDSYFTEGCPQEIRTKIYAYIAVCGLLWSNWCEYKSQLGVEFGEYSLKQYRYAKDYYKIVMRERAEQEK